MSKVDEIADLIVREALNRKDNIDIVSRICTVQLEIQSIIMGVLSDIRKAERRENEGRTDIF